MEKLSRYEIFSLALKMELPDLINLCRSSQIFNNNICDNPNLWIEKLKEFPERIEFNIPDAKKLYYLLWNLNDFNKRLGLHLSLHDLYLRKDLELDNKNLTEIPKSIRYLTNLEELTLRNNKLTEISPYYPDNIHLLNLTGNQIRTIPKNLPLKLKHLYLIKNPLEGIPTGLNPKLRIYKEVTRYP